LARCGFERTLPGLLSTPAALVYSGACKACQRPVAAFEDHVGCGRGVSIFSWFI
jgi:hypothetical protein